MAKDRAGGFAALAHGHCGVLAEFSADGLRRDLDSDISSDFLRAYGCKYIPPCFKPKTPS